MMYTLIALLLCFHFQVCSCTTDYQVPLLEDRVGPGKRLSFEDVLSGKLKSESTTLQWTSSGKDGSYFETNKTTGDLWLAHVLDEKRELLVNGSQLQSLLQEKNAGKKVDMREYKLQPQGRNILVSANYTKLYRWSGFADFYIYNPASDETEVLDKDQDGDIRYATWSPLGDSIAYIRENDLYIYRDGKRTRITSDGSPDLFNGVPDWVYEEELFVTTNTLWYSPDGRFLAFLKFNETGVPVYRVPYYMTGQKATAYPRELELRYPKAGQSMPTVSIHLLDLENVHKGPRKLESGSFPPQDLLIGEVSWITDGHSHLAWRCFNHFQDHDKLMVMEVSSGRTFVAAERNEKQGWIENKQSVRYVPKMNCYVYLSDEDGWMHIYLQYVNGTGSLQVTKGEWEVTEILHVNSDTVIYQSTERDSTERHIYSINLEYLTTEALVDDSNPGYYDASFSPEGGYYVLSYNGPRLPRQELYSLQDPTKPVKTLQDNQVLAEKLLNYDLPRSSWTTISHPEGFVMNVMELLPPRFDPQKKYPLLLNPYGGPDSQQTTKSFQGLDWWSYIASDPALEYVVLTVDGRGTGFKGRAFRNHITKKLEGYYEALDQVFAAEVWRNKSYIDSSKVVIQGWSYGGYLSAKTIELNTDVFSSAIITAPVSDWHFYDSIYTQRYMKSPWDDPEAYYKSSVHNTTGFRNARGGVLIQHGTGDDNVHFQHAAVLLDLLMTGGVAAHNFNSTNTMGALSFEQNIVGGRFDKHSLADEGVILSNEDYKPQGIPEYLKGLSESQKPVSPSKVTAQWFTDSDHRIRFHGSTLFLRKQMAKWLYREKRRKEIDPSKVNEEDDWWRWDL